jgi:sulfide:quinone oxidoreductase
MKTRVLVLGAGFGGLELTTRLSEALGDEAGVTLIDQEEGFIFGFSKLDVMFGHQKPEAVRHLYRDIVKPGVTFKQETITAIDPTARRVTTDKDVYETELLVVALGADYAPEATPGLLEGGNEFYSVAGAERVSQVLEGFDSGVALIAVLGPFFKCPPAPYEAAMLLHDYLQAKGAAGNVTIRVITPMPAPVPISEDISQGIVAGLKERGIEYWPSTKVTSLDAERRVALLEDEREIPYDLFLGIPVHVAPPVVEESGLTEEGWIPVSTDNFSTRFEGVYAIGDVTSAPVPRAGVFAEGEAAVLAEHLLAKLRGGDEPDGYNGAAVCYVEFGSGQVGKANVNFLGGPKPVGRFSPPSEETTEEKAEFGAARRRRWFGHQV